MSVLVADDRPVFPRFFCANFLLFVLLSDFSPNHSLYSFSRSSVMECVHSGPLKMTHTSGNCEECSGASANGKEVEVPEVDLRALPSASECRCTDNTLLVTGCTTVDNSFNWLYTTSPHSLACE